MHVVRGHAPSPELLRRHLTHSLGPRPELFAASRFFAAARARNEVVVTLDDDILPYPSQITLVATLGCDVARELATGGRQKAAMYSPQERHCDAEGYSELAPKRGRRRRPAILLTDFASFSRALTRRITESGLFDARYAALMRATHGNGEDIAFSDAVRRAGGALVPMKRHHVRTLGSMNSSYSQRHNHYPVRKVICCCLAAGLGGRALESCVSHVYGCCPASDPKCSVARPTDKCVATRPVATFGLAACKCGRLHFGLYNPQRAMWAQTCERVATANGSDAAARRATLSGT